MFEIVRAGGWLMAPLIFCSIIAAAIIIERMWTLKRKRVVPDGMNAKVQTWVEKGELDERHVQVLRDSSPLGRILAAGLSARTRERDIIKEQIEDTGRHVAHDLNRFLTTLGTIAAITPLIGLLGTVVGMVRVFAAITANGVGNPTVLADGISQALVTTAAGLSVAIPALIGYRYLRNHVDSLVVDMEQEATRLVDAIDSTKKPIAALKASDENAA